MANKTFNVVKTVKGTDLFLFKASGISFFTVNAYQATSFHVKDAEREARTRGGEVRSR
jgi:hypothetical protein